MDYEKKAQELLDNLGTVKDRIKGVSGLKAAIEAIPEVVALVENLGVEEVIASADKKKLAVAVINALVDIPFLPESVEGMLIGWAIDAVISAFNKLLGHNWLLQVANS